MLNQRRDAHQAPRPERRLPRTPRLISLVAITRRSLLVEHLQARLTTDDAGAPASCSATHGQGTRDRRRPSVKAAAPPVTTELLLDESCRPASIRFTRRSDVWRCTARWPARPRATRQFVLKAHAAFRRCGRSRSTTARSLSGAAHVLGLSLREGRTSTKPYAGLRAGRRAEPAQALTGRRQPPTAQIAQVIALHAERTTSPAPSPRCRSVMAADSTTSTRRGSWRRCCAHRPASPRPCGVVRDAASAHERIVGRHRSCVRRRSAALARPAAPRAPCVTIADDRHPASFARRIALGPVAAAAFTRIWPESYFQGRRGRRSREAERSRFASRAHATSARAGSLLR